MPIQNAFKPDVRSFPEDYLAWTSRLKHGGLTFENRGNVHVWILTSRIDYDVHAGTRHRHFQTWYCPASTINGSVNWRRLVAAHIRQLRFAVRRLDKPWTIDERKKPQLPWPM